MTLHRHPLPCPIRAHPCHPWLTLAALLIAALATARADVRLPALLSDNVVLQRSATTRVWGWATPGERVQVKLGPARAATTTDKSGRWQLTLDLRKLPATPLELTVSGKNTLLVRNVLVGETWVCTGQSNMEFKLFEAIDGAQEIARSANPQIRSFRAEKVGSADPLDDVKGQWVVASPDTSGKFSGVGYFFARKLNQDMKVPVGLIDISWGGSICEAWTDLPTLTAMPELADISKQQVEAFRHRQDPPPPGTPPVKVDPAATASVIYNGMLAPVIPATVAGILWYQGEGNRPRAWQYRTLFPRMIESWRKQWSQPRLPFLFCQLPGIYGRTRVPGEDNNSELRDAQMQALKLPDTAMAILIDIGEAQIHPRDKKTPGERLAVAALGTVYGKDVETSGPLFFTAKREGKHIRLQFTHTRGGLVAPPLPATWQPYTTNSVTQPITPVRPGSALQGFAICGADRKWIWADATLDGNDVLVSHPDLPDPVAVRYAWGSFPIANLYNGAGLPAAPFRTDDFPYTTAK